MKDVCFIQQHTCRDEKLKVGLRTPKGPELEGAKKKRKKGGTYPILGPIFNLVPAGVHCMNP